MLHTRKKKLAVLQQQMHCLSLLQQLYSLEATASSRRFACLATLMQKNSVKEFPVPWTEEPGGLHRRGHKESETTEATEPPRASPTSWRLSTTPGEKTQMVLTFQGRQRAHSVRGSGSHSLTCGARQQAFNSLLRCLHGITHSMDVSLSKLQELVCEELTHWKRP